MRLIKFNCSFVLFLIILSLIYNCKVLAQKFPEKMDFIFLIDVSGSMEFSLDGLNISTFDGSQVGPGDPDNPGDPPHPPTSGSWQRLWYVKNALPIIGDIIEKIPIIPDPGATVLTRKYAFGIFPGNSALFSWLTGSSSNHLDPWSQTQFNSITNGLTPRWNGTPLGTALRKANTEWPSLPSNTGRYIFLLTDGSCHEDDCSMPFSSPPPNFNIISFGLGVEGEYETDFLLLQRISNPNFRPIYTHLDIAPTNEIKNFTTTFVDAFFSSLLYPTISDPVFVMTSDSVKYFKIEVTKFDKQLYFITSWHEPKDTNKVSFTLDTPHGTLTPQNTKNLDDVFYSEGKTYLMYVINPTFLENNLGTWQLKIDGNPLLKDEHQITDYLVGGPTSLKVEKDSSTSETLILTGDSLVYNFKVLAGENIVTNVDLELHLTMPSISPGNWYAENKLSQSEINGLDTIQSPGFITDAYKKSYYIRKFKNVKEPALVTTSHKLYDDGKHADGKANDGTYGIVLANISHPGLYYSRLLVKGTTPDGVSFERQYTQTHLVEPKIVSGWKNSRYESILLEESDTAKVYRIKFTLKDEFGNYLIPGQGKYISIKIVGQQGGVIGKLKDDLQGSYIQDVWIAKVLPMPGIIFSYKDIQFPTLSLEDKHECDRLAVIPFLGNFYLDKKLNIDNPIMYGLKLRTCILQDIDLEAELGIGSSEDSQGNKGTVIKTNASIIFSFLKTGILNPYLSGGSGYINFKDFTKEYTGLTLNFGGGLKFRLVHQLSLDLEIKDHILFDALGTGTTHNFQTTIGLMFVLIK